LKESSIILIALVKSAAISPIFDATVPLAGSKLAGSL